MIERPLFVKDEWHDYDGDEIYVDWTVNLGVKDGSTGNPTPQFVPLRSHLAGVSFRDVTDPNSPVTRYFHNNHMGTTQALSDASGTRTDLFFYSAFGVQVGHIGTTDTRYGYVGAEGYQTDAATGLMHLGARYYDPAIGRFLQRDPIGITGGRNVYEYAHSDPINAVDPDGQRFGIPRPTGPRDESWFDKPWSGVHYCNAYIGARFGLSFSKTIYLAIKWEFWETDYWPGNRETCKNRIGDVVVAGMAWIDARILDPLTAAVNDAVDRAHDWLMDQLRRFDRG